MDNASLYRSMQETEARFRRLAENAPDVIYRIEMLPQPRVAYVSPAVEQVVGYTPQEFYDQVHSSTESSIPRIRSGSTQVLAGTSLPQSRLRFLHRDGHLVWIEQNTVPVYGAHGELLAVEGIARDVSARVELEEQVARAHRLEAAGQVAAQVAHDFNSWLAPLMGFPELLKLEFPPDPPRPALLRCHAAVRPAHGGGQREPPDPGPAGHFTQESTDPNRLARQALDRLGPLPRTLHVDVLLSSEPHAILGSEAQLLRVLTNLLTNARDAMQEDGTLTLRSEERYLDQPPELHPNLTPGLYVRLSISDTGAGIPPDVRPDIFDAFFSTKPAGERSGSGLGLSVVQAIVEDHGGFVEVESSPGRGATFAINLPALPELPEVRHDDDLVGGNESILVIDDDPGQRTVLQALLRNLGYHVELADSGEVAVQYLRDYTVDLLILDMVMPGADGAETYRRILQLHPRQRAIMISGYAESARVKVAQELGVGPFLRKPIRRELLAHAVRNELDRPSFGEDGNPTVAA